MANSRGSGIILLLSAILFASSCAASQSFPAQTDPDTSLYGIGHGNFDADTLYEEDHSNIIAYTENEEYPLTFEKIKVTIKNENPGRAFRFFDIPVIEYNDGGKWTRLNYSPESYEIPEQWAVCAILGESERQFSTVMSIFNDRLKGSWKAGEYRAVVFAGDAVVYAPFTLTADYYSGNKIIG